MNSLYFFALRLHRRHVFASIIWFWVLALIAPLAAQQQPLRTDSGTVSNQSTGERWVCTWATAQQLAPMIFPGANPTAKKTSPQKSAPQPQSKGRSSSPIMFDMPSSLKNQTVRMIVHTSLGGRQIRLNFSNALGNPIVQIGSARVAVHKAGGSVVPGTDRPVTFNGKPSCMLLPGVLTVSDPIDMKIPPFAELAVSLYFPHETGAPTNHRLGLHTTYISDGNVAELERMPESTNTFAYLWLTGIDVLAPSEAFTIVALGDSITDGFSTTLDANRAWPALLAKRLNGNKGTEYISVVNQGISGNQVLRDGAGLSALARFDRDVLSIAGVKWIILLEGINDINLRGRADGPDALTSDDLIAGYRQIIERSHTHGIRVIGATLTPEEGVPTMSDRGEQIRQTVNQWIRTSGLFDAVVDFDAVIRDPSRPVRMRPEFDPGDHIHPNDAGNQAMADAFDLKIFQN
jgi:lysophospholipase L1-like esterase